MPISLLQTCFVEMSIQEKEKTKVQLVPDKLEMFQKTTMAIFFFTHVTLTYKNESSFDEGIHLVLRMKRIITSEMMTTYLPTALLLLITYSTTFFKPCFFEAALSVNLTTMLVMTTIFISKMESLPQTSYMKMIDIWLILCQLAPFPSLRLFFSPLWSTPGRRRATDRLTWREAGQGAKGSKKDENSVRVEMEIDGCPAQNKPMQNVCFVQYDAPVSKMTLYPLQ